MIHTRDPAAPEELIRCLPSCDSQIRECAVQGLRALCHTNFLPVSLSSSDADPAMLHRRWERWWSANRKIYIPPSHQEIARRFPLKPLEIPSPRPRQPRPRPDSHRHPSISEARTLATAKAEIQARLADKSPEQTRKRGRAIRALRRLHHEATVPLLLAVARDKQEPIGNRQAATGAIAYVGGKSAVNALIELIDSDAPRVRYLSLEALQWMTQHKVLLEKSRVKTMEAKELMTLQSQWRAWWEKNADAGKLRPHHGILKIY